MSQLEIKPSLESYNLADIAVDEELKGEESNLSLKDAWINLGNQLQIEGIPMGQISSVASKILIEKKAEKTKMPKDEIKLSGHFYDTYQKQGWTNQFYARNTVESVPVPEQDNSSINTQNPETYTRLLKLKEIVNIAIKKINESPNVDSRITDDEFEEWDILLKILDDVFNEKTKVPVNTEQLLLFRAASSSSVAAAGVPFFEDRLELLKNIKKVLDPKQIGYFQRNEIRVQLPLLKPDSRDTAIFQGYYGLRCKSCNSWRVKELSNETDNGENLVCKDCNHIFKDKTVNKCRYCQCPLYKEDLHDMVTAYNQRIKNLKEIPRDETDSDWIGYPCPQCATDNRLPQELVDYASS